jgi:hypothetical protein
MIDFLQFSNPSRARLDIIASAKMDAARAAAGEPLARLTELVVTQDAASGLLTAGRQVSDIGYDGTVSDGGFIADRAPTEAERLDATRERIVALLLARREAQIDAGAPTSFGLMDAASESRSLINGAVSMATLANLASQPFQIAMTLKDRTPITLDGPQMVQFGVEVGTFVASIYAPAGMLEAEVRAADSVEAVMAIAKREGLEVA